MTLFISSFIRPLMVIAALTTAACSALSPNWREGNADHLAYPVSMYPRTETAEGIEFRVYERIKGGQDAVIYIEGAEDAMNNYGIRYSFNPTPDDVVALKLASFDTYPNMIYMARPCQFRTKVAGYDECPIEKYLGNEMFAPAVISAYQTAIDQLKIRHHLSNIHLVGYGSGGGIATILAAGRKDVLSLRTIAGLLDTQTFTRIHNMLDMTGSINPVDMAPHLLNTPQHHYLAQDDALIPSVVYQSYQQAFFDHSCLSSTYVRTRDGGKDWTAYWTDWSRDIPVCTARAPATTERAARMEGVAKDIGPKK